MTPFASISAPIPDLRIVPTSSLIPHEEHDSQRQRPLVERLNREAVMINPPIVAPIDDVGEHFVVLDGANRTSAFTELGYPHILVQVVQYGSEMVQLETWHHVVCQWSIADFLVHLDSLENVEQHEGGNLEAFGLASIQFRDERLITISTPTREIVERNQRLVRFVHLYQKHAILQRTALIEPEGVWESHPDGIALVVFPRYRPADVIAAARERAFIPPGITRHIVQGRALRVNYPLEILRDMITPLEEKNEQLQRWMETKVRERQMRYYAEATYLFDE